MSKTTKIVLGVVASVVVVAIAVGYLFARVVGDSFTLDAENAGAIGQEIVEHELPDAFRPFFGLDILGVRAMMAATDLDSAGGVSDEGSVVFLMSLPGGTSEADLRSQAGGEFTSQSGQNIDFEYLGSRPEMMNGEEITLEIYVGSDPGGIPIRQELGIFHAENGNPAVVMMVAPEENFDDVGFDRFLASTN